MITRFQRLYPYMWRHRLALGVGMACLVATNYMEIQVAGLIGRGTDLLALRLSDGLGLQSRLLGLFVGLVVLVGIGAGVTRFYMRHLIIGVSRHVEFEFRNDLFDHLLRLSPSFYDRNRTGDIMSRATSDMDAVRTVIGPCVMYLANTFAMLPMALLKMLRISPTLVAFCYVPMIVIIPLFWFFRHRIHDRFRRTQEYLSDLSAHVQEMLSGVRIIKTHACEDDSARRFEEISSDYVRENISLAKLQAVFIPMLGVIVGLGMLMLLGAGSWLIIRGELFIGDLVTFYLLLMASIFPMIAFGWVLAQLERGAASMQRIEAMLDARPEVKPAESFGRNLADHPPMRGHIELRDLTFHYPGAEAPALVGVSLNLEPGMTLGLTGPVGCGKSTLATLLAKRYNPPRGTVFIDGVDLLDWPTGALRRQIGIVDQEPFLFSDSIEANIGFGLNGGTVEGNGSRPVIERAAGIAQLSSELAGFPGGYATLLGERGINLSGGQRQRAALARALARDPRLLILDDALAAVDTHTEEAILRGLREVLGRRTTILISHRVSTMTMADRIMYLEQGRVVEEGTHTELIARRGPYYALAQRQRLAEEIDRVD